MTVINPEQGGGVTLAQVENLISEAITSAANFRELELGSAAAPALAPKAHPSTGMYFFNEGLQLGLSVNGAAAFYINTDGTILIAGAGMPTKVSKGTAPGTLVLPNNKFLRMMANENKEAQRVIGNNSAGEIIIGGEYGATDKHSMVMRETVWNFKMEEKAVLNLKNGEVEFPESVNIGGTPTVTGKWIFSAEPTINAPLLVKNSVKANYKLNPSGSTAFQTAVEADTSDRLTLLNNGALNFRDGVGNVRYELKAAYTRSAYTQTFATASRTNPVPTAAVVATTTPTEGAFGFTKAQAEAILAAINALVADVKAGRELQNGTIDDLQGIGIFA